MSKTDCVHEVISSKVVDGNTITYCIHCLRRIKGSKEEFPYKSPAEIMHFMVAALPESKGG